MIRKIEVAQMAGALGFYVFRDGLLDCDVPASKTRAEAWARIRGRHDELVQGANRRREAAQSVITALEAENGNQVK